MTEALNLLNQWGPIALLIIIGFAWILRVERNLTKHEDKCSERYGIIFSQLSKLREDVSTLLERTKK